MMCYLLDVIFYYNNFIVLYHNKLNIFFKNILKILKIGYNYMSGRNFNFIININ